MFTKAAIGVGSSFAFAGCMSSRHCVDRVVGSTSSRLDLGLQPRPQPQTGADGESGRSRRGFYHVQKYLGHLRQMPDDLIWFNGKKAISTWLLRAFALLILVYTSGRILSC